MRSFILSLAGLAAGLFVIFGLSVMPAMAADVTLLAVESAGGPEVKGEIAWSVVKVNKETNIVTYDPNAVNDMHYAAKRATEAAARLEFATEQFHYLLGALARPVVVVADKLHDFPPDDDDETDGD